MQQAGVHISLRKASSARSSWMGAVADSHILLASLHNHTPLRQQAAGTIYRTAHLFNGRHGRFSGLAGHVQCQPEGPTLFTREWHRAHLFDGRHGRFRGLAGHVQGALDDLHLVQRQRGLLALLLRGV